MSIDGSASVVASGAGTNIVTLQELTAGTAIELGSGSTAGLDLSDTELNRVTADELQIGSSDAGAIAVTANINPTSVTTLILKGGALTDAAGVGITATNLSLQTTSATLDGVNSVGTLAGSVTGAFEYQDSGSVTIGTVDGVNGVSAGTTLSLIHI